MENSHIEGSFLERIIHGSLALESLTLRNCHGLKSATISHSELKHFVLGSETQMENWVIETPSLQSCKYKGRYIQNGNGGFELPKFKAPDNISLYQYLHSLTLVCVCVKAEMLNNMVASLLNLKSVKIKKCLVSKRVIVSGEKLAFLVIQDSYLDENVHIQACNLQIFSYSSNNRGFTFENITFQHLRTLTIIETRQMTGDDLEALVSRSPHIVSLLLKSSVEIERMTILSSSLEYLVITECSNVKEVKLLAPKLKFLKYMGPALQFSRLLASYKLTVEVFLTKTPHDHYENMELELFKIRKFLQNLECYAESMTVISDYDEDSSRLLSGSRNLKAN